MIFSDMFWRDIEVGDTVVYIYRAENKIKSLTHALVIGITPKGLKLRNPNLKNSSVLKNTHQCVIVKRGDTTWT